jgi:putative ABC transport system substrate-binding protein
MGIGLFFTYNKKKSKYKIAVIQYVSNKSLDLLTQSFIEEIEKKVPVEYYGRERDYVETVVKNGEGSCITTSIIAEQVARDSSVDVYFTVGAVPAIEVVARAGHKPIVAAGITDPEGYGLTRKNACGWIDTLDGEKVLAHIQSKYPFRTSLVLLRSAGNNEVCGDFTKFTALAKSAGITVTEYCVSQESEIPFAVTKACRKKNSVILIPCDSLVVSALDVIISQAKKSGIPVVTAFLEGVESGATSSLGIDYEQNGKEAARKVMMLLTGESSIENEAFVLAPYKD